MLSDDDLILVRRDDLRDVVIWGDHSEARNRVRAAVDGPALTVERCDHINKGWSRTHDRWTCRYCGSDLMTVDPYGPATERERLVSPWKQTESPARRGGDDAEA